MTKLLLLLLSGAKLGKLARHRRLDAAVADRLCASCSAGATRRASSRCCSCTRWATTSRRASASLDVGAPTFIPFVGAWIELKQLPHDAETEAFVGLGGPLLGSVGALACYFIALSYDATWLLAVAYAGFFLEPVQPDSAVAVRRRAHHRGAEPAHLAAGRADPGGAVLLAAQSDAGAGGDPRCAAGVEGHSLSQGQPEAQTYYAVSTRTKWEYGLYYIVLAAFLAVMTHDVHEMLQAAVKVRGIS